VSGRIRSSGSSRFMSVQTAAARGIASAINLLLLCAHLSCSMIKTINSSTPVGCGTEKQWMDLYHKLKAKDGNDFSCPTDGMIFAVDELTGEENLDRTKAIKLQFANSAVSRDGIVVLRWICGRTHYESAPEQVFFLIVDQGVATYITDLDSADRKGSTVMCEKVEQIEIGHVLTRTGPFIPGVGASIPESCYYKLRFKLTRTLIEL